MQITIDRNLPITISEQIKARIMYDIGSGHLKAGTLLPSVRALATQLHVAPMTIIRAYHELVRHEVVEARPGIGTFVADVTGVNGSQTRIIEETFASLAEGFLRQTMALGYSPEHTCEVLQKQVAGRDALVLGPRLALVGNFKLATEAYAGEIEASFQDLNAKVESFLLDDLRSDLESLLPRLQGTKLVITMPLRLQEVRALLAPYGCKVVAIAFQVSAESRRRVASIPSEARVGVVATYPEYMLPLQEGVVSYGLSDRQPLSAYLGQEESVKEMLQKVDVVVYASGSGKVRHWLPNGVQAIEYRHVPNPDSLNRLRSLLADPQPVGSGTRGTREPRKGGAIDT